MRRAIKLPIWKILVPDLPPPEKGKTGAVYYIVQTIRYRAGGVEKLQSLLFRATFGYYGTGPHEAALIEEVFERQHLPLELRSADYLLGFLEA
jgi:hypothetical protein